MSLSFAIYEGAISQVWDVDSKISFLNFASVGIRGNEKADCATKYALRLPHVNVPINTILANISFPIGNMRGTMRLKTSLILSSQSRVIVTCHASIGHIH